MKVTKAMTIRFTTYATIEAEENEVLTKSAIEEKFFKRFGGVIIGMTDKVARISIYQD